MLAALLAVGGAATASDSSDPQVRKFGLQISSPVFAALQNGQCPDQHPRSVEGLTPQIRNVQDFSGLIAGYRRQGATDPDSCCEFSTPAFDREISFQVFDAFEPAYEAKDKRHIIAEFVPLDQTVQT